MIRLEQARHVIRKPGVQILCGSILLAALVSGDFASRPTTGARPSETSHEGNRPTIVGGQDTKPVTGYQIQERSDSELKRIFRKYDLIKLDAKQIASRIQKNGELRLSTSVNDFALTLRPHDLRAKGYRAQAIGADRLPRELPTGPVNT
jgi:hypothetical protein